MLEFIVPALQNLLTIENLIWINLGVFIGSVFAAIPGLTVILCIILFLPFTYQMTAIPGMMFLLGIYCAGGYGGSVSAILINTPGTPHAAATMLDGYPLNQKGRTKAALKIAYGAPRFALSPEDYAAYKCEEVINTTEEYLRLNAIPAISNYVILADSAYTKFEKRSEVMPGVQCTHFYRRDEGKASPIAAAICERHNGTANLAYADAHVGDSADKSSILANSKIGAYVDVAGEELTYLEVNTNE